MGLWKSFHLILMHFFIIFQCFEERLHQILLFFKNSFFLQFRSIEYVFRSIEIVFKNFSESLFVSIDQNCFSINRTSWIRFFFKKLRFDLFIYFFKLSSLSLTWQGSTEDFLSFFNQIFARFFSHKASKTFIPLILFLFSWF